MKKLLYALVVIIAVCFTSCIPSLHPLYTNDTKYEYDQAVGIWQIDHNTFWKIERSSSKDDKSYLVYEGSHLDSLIEIRTLVFVKLNRQVYADFIASSSDNDGLLNTETMTVKMHSFARVEIVEDEMTFFFPDPEILEDLFIQGKVRLKHEILGEEEDSKGIVINSDGIVITASTKDLQEFMGRYGTNKELFSLDSEMTRKAL